ncbi:6-phosphogluconolactonase [Azospirillaceae bacterium]
MIERIFPNVDVCAQALAADVAAALRERDGGSLVVPGGSTPAAFLRALSVAAGVPWENVTIAPSDERWVSPDHPFSNQGFIARSLSAAAAKAVLFPLFTGGESPAAAVADCAERIARLSLPWVATVLGVGLDGHIASLFPGGEFEDDALCCAARAPVAPVERLSLGLGALKQSERVFLLTSGPEKERAVWTAARDESSPLGRLLRLVPNMGHYHALADI